MEYRSESLDAGDLAAQAEARRQEEVSSRSRNLFPGLSVCLIASGAAAWLSEHYGAPIILMGLLIGLSLNFVASDPRTHAGLDFASRTCLRWGIVVLGTQVTVQQIGDLGPSPFLALLVVMACAIAAAMMAARFAGQYTASSAGSGWIRLSSR
jgi:uncharacterized membrane protein YadS